MYPDLTNGSDDDVSDRSDAEYSGRKKRQTKHVKQALYVMR